MKYNLHFYPKVEDDAVSAFSWYEEKAKGLGEEFLRTFYASCSKIQRNPFLYAKVSDEQRRKLLKRFPYAVYYRVIDKDIIIFGLFHCARNPATIEDTLRDRNKN